MKYYIQYTKNNKLFWSNTDGWCDNTRSLFSLEEKETLNLPIGGVWVLLEYERVMEKRLQDPLDSSFYRE